MATPRDLDKRLQALEKALASTATETVLAWTPNLAERIQKVWEKRGISAYRKYRLVTITFRTLEDELEWERGLRETNPQEAARLDALLEGRVPPLFDMKVLNLTEKGKSRRSVCGFLATPES